ncbi:hypothetical protein D3C83_90030 [compost metagenome]
MADVLDDDGGLREHAIAVLDHRRHGGRVEREELVRCEAVRLAVVPFELVGQAQLLHEPDDALRLRDAKVMNRDHDTMLPAKTSASSS